jgi:hypothetical protein
MVREDRKIRVELDAPFAGWWADIRLHPPFATAALLESEDIGVRLDAIRGLILGHNFRAEVDEETVLVDALEAPADAINQLLERFSKLKSALPNA